MRTSTNRAQLHQRTQQAPLHISASVEGKFAREIRANIGYYFTWSWAETGPCPLACSVHSRTNHMGSWLFSVLGSACPWRCSLSFSLELGLLATPAARVAWLLCCAGGVKQGGEHLWALPSNSLVPNAKLGRHNSSFIVWGIIFFSSVKKYSLQSCAAFWTRCWLDV